MSLLTFLGVWGNDLRYSLRNLLRSPVFLTVAVLALALGIGANTAIFSVMNAVVLRLLPVHDPDRIYNLVINQQPDGASNTGDSSTSFSIPVFERMREDHAIFSEVMAYVPMGFNKITVRIGNASEEATGEMVSGNYFTGLGVNVSCGRLLTPDDERHHTQTVVLSSRFWNRSFGHDCAVVGQPLYIKGVPFTIVGVSSDSFIGLNGTATDLWVPLQTRPDFNAWGSQQTNYYADPKWWCILLTARLAPGITKAQAESALAPLFFHTAYEPLGGKSKPGEDVTKLHLEQARGLGSYRSAYQKPLTMLLAMVGVILLIACGNVSLLLAVRNVARRREFSVRLALGATRIQLSRQLLVETLVLTISGAISGWLLGSLATKALASWSGIETSLQPDTRVLAFTLAVAALSTLLFGLYPILGLRSVSIGESLKTSVATGFTDASKKRIGRLTAAAQIALCLVLLVGTALLVRSLRNLETERLGMKTSGLLVFGVDPRIQSNDQKLSFYRSLLDQLRSLPRVEGVTLAGNRPGAEWSNNTSAFVDGKNPSAGRFSPMRWNNVGPDFFHTLGVPFLYGRDFRDSEGPKSPKVALVNRTFVDKYLNGRNALGHSVSFSPTIPFTIVGVVVDSKYANVREEPRPMAYLPYQQLDEISGMHVELRTGGGDPISLLPQVRRILSSIDPDLAPLQPMTQQQQFDASISYEVLIARLAMFFGFVAIVLVATGLYGTIAFSVSRRTAELGIRMALGAQQPQILRMILKEGALISLGGVLFGVPLAFAATRLLESLLYGLKANDPLSLSIAALIIATVTILACLVPAGRAASIDPAIALRNE